MGTSLGEIESERARVGDRVRERARERESESKALKDRPINLALAYGSQRAAEELRCRRFQTDRQKMAKEIFGRKT